jgi:hypothetical protein
MESINNDKIITDTTEKKEKDPITPVDKLKEY